MFNKNRLNIISSLYDASIDPNRWPGLLDQLAIEIGARSSVLLSLETLHDYKYSLNKCSSHINLQPEYAKAYERKYSHYEANHFRRVSQFPAGKIIKEIDYVDNPAEYRKRPDVAFLEEYFGIYERFAVRLNDERAWFDCITFQYDRSRENITRSEAQILRLFLPHIAKVTDLTRTFTELNDRYGAVLGVLDRLYVGVFLVLSSGEVILKNETADNIVSQNDGLIITKGMFLAASSQSANSQLKTGIRKASQTALAEKSGGSLRMKVPRPSGKESYLLDISPIKDTNNEIDQYYKGTLVVVIDCDQRPIIDISGLKTLYELTHAESQIAQHLIEGKKYREIAEIRGTTPDTVKSQVKAVLSKTRTDSRSELFRRFLNINLPIK